MLFGIHIDDRVPLAYDRYSLAGTTHGDKSQQAYLVSIVQAEGDSVLAQLWKCNPWVPDSWQRLDDMDSRFSVFTQFSDSKLRVMPDKSVEVVFLAACSVGRRPGQCDPYLVMMLSMLPSFDFCRFLIDRNGVTAFQRIPFQSSFNHCVKQFYLWSASGDTDRDGQWFLLNSSNSNSLTVYRLDFTDVASVTATPVSHLPLDFPSSPLGPQRLPPDIWKISFPVVLFTENETEENKIVGVFRGDKWWMYTPFDMEEDKLINDNRLDSHCLFGEKLLCVGHLGRRHFCQLFEFDDSSMTFHKVHSSEFHLACDIDGLVAGQNGNIVFLHKHSRSAHFLSVPDRTLSLKSLCIVAVQKAFGAIFDPLSEAWTGGINETELRHLLNAKGNMKLF